MGKHQCQEGQLACRSQSNEAAVLKHIGWQQRCKLAWQQQAGSERCNKSVAPAIQLHNDVWSLLLLAGRHHPRRLWAELHGEAQLHGVPCSALDSKRQVHCVGCHWPCTPCTTMRGGPSVLAAYQACALHVLACIVASFAVLFTWRNVQRRSAHKGGDGAGPRFHLRGVCWAVI